MLKLIRNAVIAVAMLAAVVFLGRMAFVMINTVLYEQAKAKQQGVNPTPNPTLSPDPNATPSPGVIQSPEVVNPNEVAGGLSDWLSKTLNEANKRAGELGNGGGTQPAAPQPSGQIPQQVAPQVPDQPLPPATTLPPTAQQPATQPPTTVLPTPWNNPAQPSTQEGQDDFWGRFTNAGVVPQPQFMGVAIMLMPKPDGKCWEMRPTPDMSVGTLQCIPADGKTWLTVWQVKLENQGGVFVQWVQTDKGWTTVLPPG